MTREEKLIFPNRHAARWEFATLEYNAETRKRQWERRDGSYICAEGEEKAACAVPPKP